MLWCPHEGASVIKILGVSTLVKFGGNSFKNIILPYLFSCLPPKIQSLLIASSTKFISALKFQHYLIYLKCVLFNHYHHSWLCQVYLPLKKIRKELLNLIVAICLSRCVQEMYISTYTVTLLKMFMAMHFYMHLREDNSNCIIIPLS